MTGMLPQPDWIDNVITGTEPIAASSAHAYVSKNREAVPAAINSGTDPAVSAGPRDGRSAQGLVEHRLAVAEGLQ
ncbi:hypothetical protein [Streptomyces sp. NPDC002553]|uniref:hypothetical protein n=1 Tax=Streptomyces sp. NPDC002553 TaxID=3154417 RepID=UPI00331CB0EE